MELGDEELLALLATDLDHHFRRLVENYQQRLYRFALHLTGHPADAEDIVQEAFLRAYHALKGFPASKIRAVRLRQWLYAITLNVFRNRRRRSEYPSIPLDLSEGSPLLDIADEAPGPEEDGSVRAAALRTLSRTGGHVPLEATLRLLHDADLQAREAASLTVDELGEQPQFYKEMETKRMAQIDFSRHSDQVEEQQQTAPGLNGATPLASIDRSDTPLRKSQPVRATRRHSRLLNLFNGIAAILVVGLLIMGALALFAHRSPETGAPPNVSSSVPFQPLPFGCFFLPWIESKQHCPHDPFTPLNISQHIPGYTITLKRAYADANQVLILYTAKKDANHQPVPLYLGIYSTLKTQNGITLREGWNTGDSSLNMQVFDFKPATIMPPASTRTLSLRLLMHDPNGQGISSHPVSVDFTLPFHSGRVVIPHKTVTIAGKSITLTEGVATPSETRFYLYSKDVQLDQGNDFTLSDNGENVNQVDSSVGGITNQDGYLTISPDQSFSTEIVDFQPLFASHAVCVLAISGPPGSHIGPWVFHFTIK